ncbi:tricarballylate utilization 4Fe-4S protein TcuB [Heyndrickxia ginsengihumi]|uniref:Tricarballylate utilization 4Fe-4S protein TcuB n=1 Tax=Heyndrickxia ginsengihumi TaxID=363870 RepID=A0A6M0P696_9BACI|nr:tricarballylate utilization 4Fe-4S protein TcuB [Heyndrickxia ginsengihumi]MCM3023189.1 tricarballylate utilization 4Fe-4S protein TcuB [Heyndrickxia ginsengihumi]NEY20017.1 tricarballylate utilization 4Fe-4S protein TcuB [Heyndrickxia ginsengihumi]
MQSNELLQDGKRQMKLCNACRYCEGYCAVWKAIEWRRDFTDHDMAYLANLCHDCRDCYYACPFTTPHEFGLNPPKLFSSLREKVYQQYAWPSAWGKLLGEKRRGFWIVLLVGIVCLLAIVFASGGMSGMLQKHVGTGSFYKIISEITLIVIFGILGLWMVGGWLIGACRFWHDIKSAQSEKITAKDVATATSYALSLRYLDGEGAGCKYPNDALSGKRRWLHHFVSYGFLLDLVSTVLAAFYSHVLHVQPPYPLYHPVVMLGALGGIGIIIGVSGLLILKAKSDHTVSDSEASKSGTLFSVALLTVAVTGMVLLATRETAAMGIVLIIHLGSVAALFFTAPYSKFVHFVYRYLALVRYAQEERVANHGTNKVEKNIN